MCCPMGLRTIADGVAVGFTGVSRSVSNGRACRRPSTGRHTSKNDHGQRPATTTNHQVIWGAIAKTQVSAGPAHNYDV
jgi:hypothetical protein